MIQLKNVTFAEIAARSEDQESWRYVRLGTIVRFQAARDAYGAPIEIRHAFRTKADKKRLKAQGLEVASNSAHEHGYGLDLRPVRVALGTDIESWKAFLEALWSAGFRRFGIMNNTVHVDDDPVRPQTIWRYGNTNPTIWAWVQGWYQLKTTQEKINNNTKEK